MDGASQRLKLLCWPVQLLSGFCTFNWLFCWSWILKSSSWKRKCCDLIYASKQRVCLTWSVCRALQKSNSYLLPAGHCHTQSRSLTNTSGVEWSLEQVCSECAGDSGCSGLGIRCCMMLLVKSFLGCPQLSCWSRAWHQVLFLRALQSFIGLWCNGFPSVLLQEIHPQRDGWHFCAWSSKWKSYTLHLKPCQVFSQIGQATGMECLPGIWGTCAQFPVLSRTFIFCPRQITSVLWFSRSTMGIARLPQLVGSLWG